MSRHMPGMLTKDKETQGVEQPSVDVEHMNTSGTVKLINVLSPSLGILIQQCTTH